jgi:hypothetical protein
VLREAEAPAPSRYRAATTGCQVLTPLPLGGGSRAGQRQATDRAIWPSVVLFAVLTAIALALYALAPPLAVLFAIVVLPFYWASSIAGGLGASEGRRASGRRDGTWRPRGSRWTANIGARQLAIRHHPLKRLVAPRRGQRDVHESRSRLRALAP